MKIQLPKSASFIKDKTSAKLIGLSASNDSTSMLDQITHTLVLFESYVIDTESGKYGQVSDQQPTALAEAVKMLVGDSIEMPNILLLLPSVEFIASSYHLAIKDKKMLKSALQLQAHNVIPAYDEGLMLAVDGSNSAGIALWFSINKANALFDAFKASGLFLTAIMPRSLASFDLSGSAKNLLVIDNDEFNCAFVNINKGKVKSYQHTSRIDLDQPAFEEQWQGEVASIESNLVREYKSRENWQGIKQRVSPHAAYCFVPTGAQQQVNKVESRKKIKFFSSIAAIATVVLCLPFLVNWVSIIGLENELESQQTIAAEARGLQSSIFIMEDEWGLIIEYPDLQVASVLLRLNEIEAIRNALTSVSIEQGVIDIAGSAEDPAYLVELLAEYDEFYNITQSRSISGGNNAGGNRFGLRMNLSDVDFDAYEEKYPTTE